MSKPELLPCPFCGEHAIEGEILESTGCTRYEVECTYCNASVYSYTSMKRAVQAWNVRSVNAAPELLEACQAMLAAFEYSGRRLVGAEFEAKEKLLAAVEKAVQS